MTTTPVLLSNTDGTDAFTIDVLAEIVAPGLAITPAIENGPPLLFTSGWVLTLIPSGHRLNTGRTYRCLSCIRDYAAAAVATGVDWTLPHADLTALINAGGPVTDALTAAARELMTCVGTQCFTVVAGPTVLLAHPEGGPTS